MAGEAVDREPPFLLARREVLAGGAALPWPRVPGAASTRGGRALDPVLADLHRRTFDFFWQTTDAATGLAPDSWPNAPFASIAATGFALSAYPIGVANGYVSRGAAALRTLTTLRTFWHGPQGDAPSGTIGHHGFFYHFLDTKTASRYRDVELSSVDTAWLLMGVLCVGGFFDQAMTVEREIRRLALAIYDRVDWQFLARANGLVSMGWHPETAIAEPDTRGLIERNWDRYNEGMIVTLLALGSRTHPVNPDAWDAWSATVGGTWATNFGETYLGFSPLFGHQYSHCWIDFHGIADAFMREKGIDYFENSRRATLAQRNYAIANPGGFTGYGADCWGLTACRGPGDVVVEVEGRTRRFAGYAARGIQDGDGESIDDGTIAPAAGAGSIAFAPDVCTALVHALRRRYGPAIYGRYGFYDGFNPTFPASAAPRQGRVDPIAGWVADCWLGIDQGPILLMLENHRSGLIWDVTCRGQLPGAIVRRALKAAKFAATGARGRWLDT